jgi:hypothetical protein
MNGIQIQGLHCPRCYSSKVVRELRPCIGMEHEGDTTYMLNGAVTRCKNCGHAWDRTAFRGMGLKNYPYIQPKAAPAKRPGLLTRLFRRIFALVS